MTERTSSRDDTGKSDHRDAQELDVLVADATGDYSTKESAQASSADKKAINKGLDDIEQQPLAKTLTGADTMLIESTRNDSAEEGVTNDTRAMIQMTVDEFNAILELRSEMKEIKSRLEDMEKRHSKTDELQGFPDFKNPKRGDAATFDCDIDIDESIDAKQKEKRKENKHSLDGMALNNDCRKKDQDELRNLIEVEEPQPNFPKQEGDEWHTPFGESIYTLLYMCEPNSLTFWYAVFIYVVQLATITLTLLDIIDPGSNNPLRLPPMVALTVTLAQDITIFLVLAYMSDLIEALLKLQDGFYPEILDTHPGATFSTWLVSCLCQASSGLMLLVTIFILTMQVDTVLSIMLNFAALHFMSEIDDIAFSMARMGFVTDQIQQEVEAVVDFQLPKRQRRTVYRRVLYALTMIGLFIGYGILKNQQLTGVYLQTYVYVQFGDAYNCKIPYYTGIMSSDAIWNSGFRRYRDITENILLSYCDMDNAWTFSFSDANSPCDYFAKSLPTATYDVTTISDVEWQVLDSDGRLQPFDSFSLVGKDCQTHTCKGTCGKDGLCQCEHDKFGLDCEFSDVCQELVLDGRFSAFQMVINDPSWFHDDSTEDAIPGDKYSLLKDDETGAYVRGYNMPV
jgi:hypothetical protein